MYEVNFDPLGAGKRKRLKRSQMQDFRDPKHFISNTPSQKNVYIYYLYATT